MSDRAASSARMAFGVDPTRKERYSLRQARYQAIAETVAQLAQERVDSSKPLKLLDVGVWNGVSMRYIEPHVKPGDVEFHGVDLKLHAGLYRRDAWTSLQEGNLLDSFPFLASGQFDVVICEQVLEHLPQVDGALETLCRVVKPGGLMILGVPIFPPGIDQIRKHAVPALDRLVGKKKPRGHLQAFSRSTFLAAIQHHCDVNIVATRGFRMISGGLLRPLEDQKWWWKLNCALGSTVPGLCTELQVLARKKPTASIAAQAVSRAA